MSPRRAVVSYSDKTMRYLLLIILPPVTACIGFLVGGCVAIAQGLSLHDNYEYFSPDYGAGSARMHCQTSDC